MRRPRRRLVYTTGLRDSGKPSGEPLDSSLWCDDFEPRGATSPPSAAPAAAQPSTSPHGSRGANPSTTDLRKETIALQQIRWEVQQLELETNYSRILQDLSTSRIVLEELVDQVVASSGTCFNDQIGAEEARDIIVHGSSPAAPDDEGTAAGRTITGRGWPAAPRDCSSSSLQASGHSIKEITSERIFARRFHVQGRNAAASANQQERLARANSTSTSDKARATESMLSALERVKKIRDTLAGRPRRQSAVPGTAAEWDDVPQGDDITMGAEPSQGGNIGLATTHTTRRPMMLAALQALPLQDGSSSRLCTTPSPSTVSNPVAASLGLDLISEQQQQQHELESSLWGTLPFDLVERILARLPLPCLLSCRAVCRKWNRTLLDDRGFLAVYSRVPPQKPWLFTWDSWIEDDSHAYNPRLDRWYKIPLRFIPHEHVKRPLHIVGAVSGLLFFEYFARLYIALCVCNPVTKAWRKLPPLNEKRVQPVVAVFEDRETRGEFTVVVAGGLSKPSVMHKVYSTEIFDSRTNSWRKTCDKITDDGGHIRWGPYVRTAFCNGNLYYMLWRFKILAYNLRRGTWTHVSAPSPPALDPESGISPFLVESKGKLLMVGFLDNDSHVAQDGLAIWELNVGATAWVEIARMPDHLFASMPLRKIQGVGSSDLIYIFENFSAPVVICDLSKQTPDWKQIDSGCIRGNHRVIYGCTTDLRLDAPVT